MWLRTNYEISFEILVPTPFIFMIRPHTIANQEIRKNTLEITPTLEIQEFNDQFGNATQRIFAPVGILNLKAISEVKTVEIEKTALTAPFIEIQHLPNEILKYLLPSRYCESDRFGELANQIVKDQNPGYPQVLAIENWLKNTISFIPGSSDIHVSASEVNNRKSGVCRDLAHLGIALCRNLSIPARIVVGFMYDLQPMDMHAWFEAYVGDTWYTFDASEIVQKGGYVVLGYGRDAADVAVYNQFGPLVYGYDQQISVTKI